MTSMSLRNQTSYGIGDIYLIIQAALQSNTLVCGELGDFITSVSARVFSSHDLLRPISGIK